MFKQAGYTTFQLVIVIVGLLSAVGWIANIVKVVWALSDPITGMLILRCVGIVFVPLGVVLGFM